MAPTMLFKNDRPWLITGTPGGSTIIDTVPQVIVNAVDFDLNIGEAVHVPRIYWERSSRRVLSRLEIFSPA